MASSSNQDLESLPEASGNHPSFDIASEIGKESIARDIEGLKTSCSQLNYDGPNKDVMTPLMIACRKGLKDIVKFLLEKGANPNYQCSDDGNTPLHFVCLGDVSVRADIVSPLDEETLVDIVRMLLNHGAQVRRNNDGLSPVCVAGLYGLNSVVEFFFTSDQVEVPSAEKVRSLELLGVAQSVLGYFHPERAHEAFCRALEYRESSAEEFPTEETQPIALLTA